ncbi:MAG: MFS transporter [bacterium]
MSEMGKQGKIGVGIVLAIAGLYFFSYFQRVAVPGSIFNDIQSEFLMTASEVTKLSAIYLFLYAAMQPFAGYMADRWGGIKVVLVSGVLFVIGSTLFPLACGKWGLYGSRALVGLGSSTMYLCMVKETDHYFSSKNFAPVFGLLCVLGSCGGLVGTRPFRMLVEHIGWRHSCMAVAVATGVVLILAWLIMRQVEREVPVKSNAHLFHSVVGVFKNKLNYPILGTIPLCFGIYFSIQATIGPKFLQDFCGLSSLASSNFTFAMMLSMLTVMLFSGLVSKQLGSRRKGFLVFNSVATMVAMLTIVLGIVFKLPPAIFLCAFVLSAAAAGCTPVNAAFMKELNPPGNVAVSIGIFNTVTYAMVALMAQGVGQVLDHFKASAVVVNKVMVYPPAAYLALFGILLGVSIWAFTMSLYSRETHGLNINGK